MKSAKGHFTVVCFVLEALNRSEAVGDLIMLKKNLPPFYVQTVFILMLASFTCEKQRAVLEKTPSR